MPALLLLTGPSAGLRYDLVVEATLGRSPSCEIPLEDSKVSRRHAKIQIADGQARITDLGSRNGTVVNGERIESEAILLPGDRLQVGDSTILFSPPANVSLADRETGEVDSLPVEELWPAVGPEAALFSASVSLFTATSEAMVLRRAVEELARSTKADRAAVLLGGPEGLITAAVVGAEQVEVPRSLARGALERREAGRAGGVLCAPLVASGGAPFGLLYAERRLPFAREDQSLAAALGRLVGEAFSAVRSRSDREPSPVQMQGTSRPFRKTLEQARRAAAGIDPVVLFGEPGVGKTLAAQYIHSRSPRALGPLVTVVCLLPAPGVDEALFGRPSGPGVPPLPAAALQADGGTLLIKHLELLSRQASERLTRLLVNKVAPALQGGEETVDLRVIVTACAAPEQLVARGELDPALAAALSGNEIEVPPLRERHTDVPGLFELFAGRVARPVRRDLPGLSPEARRLLVDYLWPGNVRELKGVAERLALLYGGMEVSARRLPLELQDGGAEHGSKTLQERISKLERDAIAAALRDAKGKKIHAAAILGISRPTLDKKIEDYQLTVEKGAKP